MFRPMQGLRGLRSKVIHHAFRGASRGRATPVARAYSTSSQKAGLKVVPYALGVGIACFAYAQLNRDVEARARLFGTVEAEAPDESDYQRRFGHWKDELKKKISTSRMLPFADVDEGWRKANALLKQNEQSLVMDGLQADSCYVPSNSGSGEDRYLVSATDYTSPGNGIQKMHAWSIYDGHAGHATADFLRNMLDEMVFRNLVSLYKDPQQLPKDMLQFRDAKHAIEEAFIFAEASMMTLAEFVLDDPTLPLGSPTAVQALAPVMSGSCALMAIFDPAVSILRVACVGDSRAVLGRADWLGNYNAMPLSVDQTGFNPAERARIMSEHPADEKVIDDKEGRVQGLAVSRAFGDARWKWEDKKMLDAQRRFWSYGPRPGGVIETPPYLIAKPEVTETKISTSQPNPDFLIMGSDGLWDLISNEDAVLCVQRWLQAKKGGLLKDFDPRVGQSELKKEIEQGSDLNQDTFYIDAHGGDLKWKVKPEHFVVEDDNCATHLIKNVLGGSRRALFCGLLDLPPPSSRNARDDITVHVVFFGKV